ncbi:hypothetical protein Tco_0874823 [Tanacetum coccineum]|uniref:Reverse transcriptase Ty1/copia-type domain-containing protein n=1 Tax=Tanacetum coccineum TaxID=301880 RepID=A0ABQ5BQJ1_9ASTR
MVSTSIYYEVRAEGSETRAEGSSKRAGEELEHENIKKQKVDGDKETTELKSLMEVILDEEEVSLDAIPLAVKSPSIVDWKIHKEGKKSYYQIIRVDVSSKMYLVFSHMLKSFDREDLETLYKLVKAKYGSIIPVEDLDLVLYRDLKTMFEPHVEDNVWKNQSDYRVLDWKLYDSCGVHFREAKCAHSYVGRKEISSYSTYNYLYVKQEASIVTAAQLMLLVYKLLLLVLKVNAASTKVTTAQRLRLLKEFLLSEKG